jgi:uncharacterized Zn ribbon protein
MKACPKCQTKNQESNNFCKKCGVKLSGAEFQDKKEKVLGEKKKSSLTMISMVIVAVALGGIAYWIIKGNTLANSGVSSVSPQPKVSGNVDYTGQNISMTDIQPTVKSGKISIPLDLVLEKRLVRYEYETSGNKIPLLSYVTSSGKVITAVSMCEPCRSTRFHIEGKTIVCNACATKWNLETLKGISGGCLNYPPDVIPSVVDNGLIQIDEKTVVQWKPRV